MAETDLLELSLKNMIGSVESYFDQEINSLKAQIFDIEHDKSLSEERYSLCKPYYDQLEESETQRFHARNKLVTCIYSICEASLAGICKQYKIPLKFSPQNRSKKDHYFTDYLFSIGVDYTNAVNSNSSYVVYNAIKELRNTLTHCGEDNQKASKAVKLMKKVGFAGIENYNGVIRIETKNVLEEILNHCKKMLIDSENTAINLSKQLTKSL